MASETARVLDYSDEYIYGTEVPARRRYEEPEEAPVETASPRESLRPAEQAAAATAARSFHGVSMFAIFGSLFVGVLMIFAILAQINYNEVADQTTKLKGQLRNLEEQERRLEITFESVVDMKEVERYARDVLGMSKPDAEQVTVIQDIQQDTAEIVDSSAGNDNALHGFGSFISSLVEYLKR